MTEKRGIAHIFASYNNINITVTDATGAETVAKCTGGMVVKSDKDKGGPFAAMSAAQKVAEQVNGGRQIHNEPAALSRQARLTPGRRCLRGRPGSARRAGGHPRRRRRDCE